MNPTKGNIVAKNRIKLEVLVDLDDMPGAFHTKEDAALRLEAILLTRIPHYNPIVLTPLPE